jgi:hypothetical protein
LNLLDILKFDNGHALICPFFLSDIFTIHDYDSGNRGFISLSRKSFYHVQTFFYQGTAKIVKKLHVGKLF